MSHTTTIKSVPIKDIAALRAAVKDLQDAGVKCELRENVRPRMYSDAQSRATGVCDYVLHLDNSPYDVAFVKQKDGSYAPAFDEWSGRVAGQIGASCPLPNTAEGRAQHAIGKLMQGYGKHAAMNQARAEGYIVESATYDKNQNLVLTLGVS